MFKNFFRFLFEEEDEEIIEEKPLEEVHIRQTKVEPLPVAKSQPVKENEKIIKAEMNRAKAPQVKSTQQMGDNKPKKHFIDFDEPQLSRANTTSHLLKDESKRDFEFVPVISPMYGTKEDLKTKTYESGTVVSKSKKHNPLGTVLSPMYGAPELEEIEEAAQAKLLKSNTADAEETVDNLEVYPFDAFEELENAHDNKEMIFNTPLEDLLVQDSEEESDDLMQFSLFGGEEAIKDSSIDTVYSIKEEE